MSYISILEITLQVDANKWKVGKITTHGFMKDGK